MTSELRYDAPPTAVMSLFYQLLPPGRVLTVGCGSEDGSGSQLGQNVVFSDLSERAAGGRPFVAASAERLPFANASFDALLAKDVLEHIPDVIGTLSELRRVAKDCARIVVIVPRAIPRAVWGDPTHVRGFTQSAIQRALAAGGWDTCSAQHVGGLPGLARLGQEHHLLRLMRIPGLSHRFGTNWLIQATAQPTI